MLHGLVQKGIYNDSCKNTHYEAIMHQLMQNEQFCINRCKKMHCETIYNLEPKFEFKKNFHDSTCCVNRRMIAKGIYTLLLRISRGMGPSTVVAT